MEGIVLTDTLVSGMNSMPEGLNTHGFGMCFLNDVTNDALNYAFK